MSRWTLVILTLASLSYAKIMKSVQPIEPFADTLFSQEEAEYICGGVNIQDDGMSFEDCVDCTLLSLEFFGDDCASALADLNEIANLTDWDATSPNETFGDAFTVAEAEFICEGTTTELEGMSFEECLDCALQGLNAFGDDCVRELRMAEEQANLLDLFMSETPSPQPQGNADQV